MERHNAITAMQLTDRSYFLTDLYIAYVFFEGRQYDFWKEHYGEKFHQHMFEAQSRAFNRYDLKKLKGLSQIDNTFAGDPIKHRAFNFLLAECYPSNGERGQNVESVNLKRERGQKDMFNDIEPLERCSAFLFFLSVCYKDFHIFAKEVKRCNNSAPVEVYHYLEGIRGKVLVKAQRALDELCRLVGMRQRASKGGKASKSSAHILASIRMHVNEKPNHTAQTLWGHYRRDHAGEKNADDQLVFHEKDNADPDEDRLVDAEGKYIRFNTFRGRDYFGQAKKRIMKKVAR